MAASELNFTHKTQKDYLTRPWKNGGGETHELAIDSAKPFHWRLSWAPIFSSGPFSEYKGYDRTIVLISGGPLLLQHSTGKMRELLLFVPYHFQGDYVTTAEVSIKSEDFNLFTLRNKAKGNVYPSSVRAGEEMQYPLSGSEHFIFCVDGHVQVDDRNTSQSFQLKSKELLQVSRTSKKEWINLKAVGKSAQSSLLWVVVHQLA